MDHGSPIEPPVTATSEPSSGARRPPAMSVIVTTPDSYDTIRPLIGRLRAQTARDALEIVLVAPSVEAVRAGLTELQDLGSWRVIEVGALRTVAQAKAAGIRHAAAPVVVLTEDHSLPHPTWAEALIDAHRRPWAAVGPAMDNANPESLISWADFTIGYGAWLDPAAGEADCLPGHNSAYKRDILLGFGDRLEELLGVEAALHAELRARGWRLCMEPAAKTFHVNFTQLTPWVFYLLYSGRLFAAERARSWSPVRRAVFSGAAWLIPFVRLTRSVPQLRRARPELIPRVLPALLFALILDGIGQWLGCTLGAGQAAQKVARLEFHRAGTASADAALRRRDAGSAVPREA